MSRNKNWSILLRVFVALVVAGVGVVGGYLLWGRAPVPQAFFERPGGDEAFPVREEVLRLISNARHEVLVIQMEEGDAELLEALASVSADASVRFITASKKAEQSIQSLGADVEIEHLETRGVLNHGFVIVDGSKVLTGSYNWSGEAYKGNWENAVLITNRTVAESFQREFEYLWSLAQPKASSGLEAWDELDCLERLNAARFADLIDADGIADVLAMRILEYRETHGGFAAREDLNNVAEIGIDRSSDILEELGCSTH